MKWRIMTMVKESFLWQKLYWTLLLLLDVQSCIRFPKSFFCWHCWNMDQQLPRPWGDLAAGRRRKNCSCPSHRSVWLSSTTGVIWGAFSNDKGTSKWDFLAEFILWEWLRHRSSKISWLPVRVLPSPSWCPTSDTAKYKEQSTDWCIEVSFPLRQTQK